MVTTQGGTSWPTGCGKRGVLHSGRACDGHGYKILLQLYLCEGAGEGDVREKAKHEKDSLEQRRSFMALIYSVDGITCKDARTYEKRIANLLAGK